MTKFLAGLAVCAVSWLLGSYVIVVIVESIAELWIRQLPLLDYPTALIIGGLVMIRAAISGVASGIIRGIYKDGDR
jgi:hypothetical protein